MNILYICNCKAPCHKSVGCISNGGPCSHTSDINYAKNYTEVPIVKGNDNFVDISNAYREACYTEINPEEENLNGSN